MFRTLFILLLAIVLIPVGRANAQTPESIDEKATHEHSSVIRIQDGTKPLSINAFCLNGRGQIVAACGNGPGEVRVCDDNGKILRSWEVDVKPEAVSVAADQTVLVGGEGKLFRYSADGNELQQAESPHAAALRSSTDELRKEAVQRLTRATTSLQSRIDLYERVIQQLEDKGKKAELNDQEMKMLELLPKTLEQFRKQAAAQPEEKKEEPGEEAIAQYVKNLLRSKMKISSISSDGGNVFVATRAQAGYGFDIWKMNREFSQGSVIVTGLRGCCGQMDVQCCEGGIFVAENSRHRVVKYNSEGEQITTWGERDRTGVKGFSSCCNPMNVCFNGVGDVFTAESGTGRIKRFSPDGEFVSYVGDVELVPGCKNVSIAVSPDASRVYMLDLTRNHIVRMEAKPGGEATEAAADTTGE